MIGLLKVVAIILGSILEKQIGESLLESPLSTTFDVVLGLVTFGADDFLDFLNAYFIELGLLMFERPYLEPIVNIVFEYLEGALPKVKLQIVRWFSN